jgi:hypothetical protein
METTLANNRQTAVVAASQGERDDDNDDDSSDANATPTWERLAPQYGAPFADTAGQRREGSRTCVA